MKNINQKQNSKDIPVLDFKNAILLITFVTISFIITSFIVEAIPAQFVLIVIIIASIIIGFGISLILLILKHKRNIDKYFYILGFLLSILAFMMLFSFYYLNILV